MVIKKINIYIKNFMKTLWTYVVFTRGFLITVFILFSALKMIQKVVLIILLLNI